MNDLSFLKNGLALNLKVNASNIILDNNLTLELVLSSENQVTANYNSGVKIATIQNTDVYAPVSIDSATININGIVYFDTVLDLQNSNLILQAGTVACTKGFYEINDGGGASYIIISSIDSAYIDNATVILTHLKDGSVGYADLMLPTNNVINFRLFGAKNLTAKTLEFIDNKDAMKKYLDFCDRYECTFTLYIPAGTWPFGETDIIRTKYPLMGVKIIGDRSSDCNCTTIVALGTNYQGSLLYVWRFGNSTTLVGNNTILDLIIGSGLVSYSLGYHGGVINELNNDSIYGDQRMPTSAYIQILNSHNDYWNLIDFRTAVCGLMIENSHALKFGWCTTIGCGANNPKGIWMFGGNVYNVVFDYTNYESSYATLAYGYSTDDNALCQIVFNNIQFEGLGTGDAAGNILPGKENMALANFLNESWKYLDSSKRFFVFEGHLGSPNHPVIINTFTATKFDSTIYYRTSTDTTISGADNYLVSITDPNADDFHRTFYYYFGGTYGGMLMGMIGHGEHDNGVYLNIIVNNIFTNVINGNKGPWYKYDISSKGDLTINQLMPKDLKYFHFEKANTPLLNINDSNVDFIYAYQCGNVKVTTKDGAYSPFSLVGDNESNEYYEFYAVNGRTYNVRFNTYQTSGVSTKTFNNIIIEAYNYSNNTWTLVGSGSITGLNDGWTTCQLPAINITMPKKIRIKGLPRFVDYFN